MHVGSVVKCINGDFSMYPDIHTQFQVLPKEGVKYTIREIRPKGAEGGLLLEEIENKPLYYAHFMGYLEPAFHPRRFAEEIEMVESIKEVDKVAVTV